MHDRTALGAADVTDDVLRGMVADLLEVPDVELLSSVAEEHAYAIPALTTAGRHRVCGTATAGGQIREWALFVKQVREWSRSPYFATVPEEFKATARQMVPWRTEAEVYRSDLATRLPQGLALPLAVGVHEIDESSYAVWLESVPTTDVTWDLERYRRAAGLLGRFAACEAVRELADVGGHPWDVSFYTIGRVEPLVVPALRSEAVWAHPLMADAFGPLRSRLLDAADRTSEITAELMSLLVLAGHGDGCPNNLLVRPDRDGFTMIDFGFFGARPVGFDLGQLLVGDVQIGRHPADDLAERDEVCVTAYHEGLGAEGADIDRSVVRRAHALQLILFTGLSTPPFELLELEPTPALHAVARSRSELARYSLDLLDATG